MGCLPLVGMRTATRAASCRRGCGVSAWLCVRAAWLLAGWLSGVPSCASPAGGVAEGVATLGAAPVLAGAANAPNAS